MGLRPAHGSACLQEEGGVVDATTLEGVDHRLRAELSEAGVEREPLSPSLLASGEEECPLVVRRWRPLADLNHQGATENRLKERLHHISSSCIEGKKLYCNPLLQ